MQITVDGLRLEQDWDTGVVSAGAKPTIKVANTPKVVWNGNPLVDPSCVLYLPGHPGSGSTIYDFSGKGNNGTINGATWKRLPSGLRVLSFDGNNDEIDCGNDSSLFPANGTFLCWAKLTPSDFQSLYSTDASGGNAGDAYLETRTAGDLGRYRWNMHDGSSSSNIISNVGTVADGTPQLIGVNWGTAGMKMFVNSVKQTDTDAGVTQAPVANQNLILGNYRPGGSDGIDGWQTLQRIFGSPLSDGTHLGIFNQERHLFGR